MYSLETILVFVAELSLLAASSVGLIEYVSELGTNLNEICERMNCVYVPTVLAQSTNALNSAAVIEDLTNGLDDIAARPILFSLSA